MQRIIHVTAERVFCCSINVQCPQIQSTGLTTVCWAMPWFGWTQIQRLLILSELTLGSLLVLTHVSCKLTQYHHQTAFKYESNQFKTCLWINGPDEAFCHWRLSVCASTVKYYIADTRDSPHFESSMNWPWRGNRTHFLKQATNTNSKHRLSTTKHIDPQEKFHLNLI